MVFIFNISLVWAKLFWNMNSSWIFGRYVQDAILEILGMVLKSPAKLRIVEKSKLMYYEHGVFIRPWSALVNLFMLDLDISSKDVMNSKHIVYRALSHKSSLVNILYMLLKTHIQIEWLLQSQNWVMQNFKRNYNLDYCLKKWKIITCLFCKQIAHLSGLIWLNGIPQTFFGGKTSD